MLRPERTTPLRWGGSRCIELAGGTAFATYSRCGSGRLAFEDFTQPDVRLDYWGQAAGTYAGFDRFGRVKQQLWRYYGGTPADRDKFIYEYDRNSNRLGRHNAVAADRGETYQYDSLNRLVDFAFNKGDINSTSASSRNQTWTLDQVGNWRGFVVKQDSATVLDQARANNKANEITSTTEAPGEAKWAQPAWSARGNMTTVPQPADPMSAYACKYDAWNRLVEVKDGESTVATYKYDGLNRRFQKTTGGSTYDCYYNNGWQALEIRKDGSANPWKQNVWSIRYIDAAVCRFYDANTDGLDIETLNYCNDANMNVTALVQGQPGHEDLGKVVERYVYDPYGKVTALHGDPTADADGGEVTEWAEDANPDWDNCILYCGYYRDPETGFYHVRNRMYHPTLGQWLERDPIGYADGMSLYEYVGGNPAGALDPMGTQKKRTLSKYDMKWLKRYIQVELQNQGGMAPAKGSEATLKERACYNTGKMLEMEAASKAILEIGIAAIKAPIMAVRTLYGEQIIKELAKKVGKKLLEKVLKEFLKKHADELQVLSMKTKKGPNGCHCTVQIVYNKKTGRFAGTLSGQVRCKVKRLGGCTKEGKLESFKYNLSGKVKWQHYSYLWGLISGDDVSGVDVTVQGN